MDDWEDLGDTETEIDCQMDVRLLLIYSGFTYILAETQDSGGNSPSAFYLTFNPPEVIRDVTRNIQMACVFNTREKSQKVTNHDG
ncbi:hypothetical protein RRG08_036833 [Elysia crispata]|uniref:Uncharacterized protein n=1 Tax=Elysia crispata TaxID=231223 RepID=A0AAE0Y818_9GAST|nr:hypothetical protein RRG08_036833 [Elysia crispata]